jgi:ApaG protein
MYSETTHSIRVSVESFYLESQSAPEKRRWVFGYRVTIANEGTTTVQLLRRYWRITDGRGEISEVRGDGVVGEQPKLAPGQSFQYTSGAPLPTPNGIMVGSYVMSDEHGREFDVKIPAFSLDAPEGRGPLN